MSAQLEKIVKTYKTLAQIPALASATLLQGGNVVSSVWSQRNLERGKTTKFLRLIYPYSHNEEVDIGDALPIDVSNELLTKVSPSERFRAVLREVDSKQFLEVWEKNRSLSRCVDFSALDVHGSVYTDVEFASFEFSPDESKILYVAEKKPPKTEPFYKRKAPKKENGSGDDTVLKGEDHTYRQDWGEQLVGKIQSVLVQYDIENDSVEILEGVPADICPAQPIYSPQGDYVVGVAYRTTPRKLGLIYCSNRPSSIFKLDFEGNYEEIPSADVSVKSPRFTADESTLVYLQRSAGGPHGAALALVKTSVPFGAESEAEVVVDVVRTEVETTNGTPFYGIYSGALPKRCALSERRIVFSTNQRNEFKSYVVDIDSGDITELEYSSGSQIVLDVVDDKVLVVRRNFLIPDKLALTNLASEGEEANSLWLEITEPPEVESFTNLTYHYLELTAPNSTDEVRNFTTIYIGPEESSEREVPLIVFPHGGPHSAFANFFFLECALFTSLGYAVLLVNYRGSIGAGQDSVEFLNGRVGKADVSDCILATVQAFIQYPWVDSNRTVLVGGSHGGFLVAHLSGQYPDMFKAVVARNPVIDVASMSIFSDIPDWCFVEGAAQEYSQVGEPSSEILVQMRKASPIQHAHKVKAPTLLQVGSKDLRVPAGQAMEYYHRLKANGVVVKMNLYDDNHPLGNVPNEMDNLINTVVWIEQHIGRNIRTEED